MDDQNRVVRYLGGFKLLEIFSVKLRIMRYSFRDVQITPSSIAAIFVANIFASNFVDPFAPAPVIAIHSYSSKVIAVAHADDSTSTINTITLPSGVQYYDAVPILTRLEFLMTTSLDKS